MLDFPVFSRSLKCQFSKDKQWLRLDLYLCEMFKSCIFLLLILSLEKVSAQILPQLGFERSETVEVKIDGNVIENPWTGGLNFCQFSAIDLNFDGKKDLFIFDRSGNKVLTFINEGNAGEIKYRHAPEYKENFPTMLGFSLLRDIDCDGKEDIITYGVAGFKIYKNISTPENGIAFELFTDDLQSQYGAFNISIYVIPIDVPAIVDVDGDGDLDILVFSILGQCVEYHRNMSIELHGDCSQPQFKLETDNWGNFTESFNTNEVFLNDSCDGFGFNGAGPPRHAGSNLLAIDVDDDGDLDLVLGDIAYKTLIKLINGGTAQQAYMIEQINNFPQETTPVNVSIFPAGYYLDIDNDGINDLIVCPNSETGSENFRSVWYYKNNGQNSLPDFEFIKNNFIQDETLDFGEGAYPVFVDINRDGLQDIVVGNYGYFSNNSYVTQLAYLQNIGTPTQPAFELITRNLGNFSTLAASTVSYHPTFGDLDDDGDLDMLIGLSDGRLYYFENIAAQGQPANFVLSAPFFMGIDVGTFAAPFLIDINRDGLLDLIIGNRTGKIQYFSNTGTPFQSNFTLVSEDWGNVNVSAPGDFEGFAAPFIIQRSGKHHLYVGSRSGSVYYYGDIETDSPETFTLLQNDLFGNKDGLRSKVSIADINADGRPDAVIGYFGGGLSLYLGADPTHLNELNRVEQEVFLYPNPVLTQLNYRLNFHDAKTCFYLYDLSGRLIESEKIYQNSGSLNISKVAQQGMYFVVFEGDWGKTAQKIIIHK